MDGVDETADRFPGLHSTLYLEIHLHLLVVLHGLGSSNRGVRARTTCSGCEQRINPVSLPLGSEKTMFDNCICLLLARGDARILIRAKLSQVF